MSYVKPGMLAVVIPARDGTPMITPGICGRIVFVERINRPGEIFKDAYTGVFVQVNAQLDELAWVVSAKEPLPALFGKFGDGDDEMWHFYERPIADQCLKAISGPELGITEEDVRELYSPKDLVSV